MKDTEFADLITSQLPYTPNVQQEQVIGVLSRFCAPTAPDDSVFLLNGYAGTGKTSLCGALVRSLATVGIHAVLLAPTGRAAKVFATYASHSAGTIHKEIYTYGMGAEMSTGKPQPRENKRSNTFFIVDEASMITGDEGGGDSVLADLIHYVYTGDRCRLILLGDTAQLPPVGCEFSPAMDTGILRSYGLRVTRVTLTEIARQGKMSGILANATWLRRTMRMEPLPQPRVLTGYPDVREIEGEDMPEELYNAYNRDGREDTIVITRSNQRAVGFNREIRLSVLYLEDILTRGEMIIVSKNNYYWVSRAKEAAKEAAKNRAANSLAADPAGPDYLSEINFIANGDIMVVKEILGIEEKYGFRWADVVVSPSDNGYIEIPAKLMLASLSIDRAHLPQEEYNRLYYAIMEDPALFSPYTPADARLKVLRTNPYWNALHAKYAYAVTCHKAQGGQWSNVFVDMSYISPDALGVDLYRWLYTAVTRARKRLWIIK